MPDANRVLDFWSAWFVLVKQSRCARPFCLVAHATKQKGYGQSSYPNRLDSWPTKPLRTLRSGQSSYPNRLDCIEPLPEPIKGSGQSSYPNRLDCHRRGHAERGRSGQSSYPNRLD